MATVTVQDVITYVPELKAFSQTPDGEASIQAAIVVAVDGMDEGVFGARFTYAAALLTAHTLLTTNPSLGGLVAGGGVVQSVSVGGVSTTFASSSSVVTDGPHSSTRYGVLYDTLVRGLIPTISYYV